MCEIQKKNSKICKCGNTFIQYSSLVNKCPACQIKALNVKKAKSGTKLPFQVQKFNTGQKTRPKRQKTEKQKAKANAWTWFSRYIRLSNSVNGQYVICYTCGTPHGIKEVDAGHFIPGRKDEILFKENGCRPQCRQCNRFKQGEFLKFEIHLIQEIGIEKVDELKEQAKKTLHLTDSDYRQIAFIYKGKVENLQKKYGIKLW